MYVAYRSMHTGVVLGQQIIQIFYEQNYMESYYLDCSTGWCQGAKSVQIFPSDSDGIVAGASAFDFVDFINWSLWLQVATGFDNTSSAFVPQQLWNVVHVEILKQYDGLDGAVER